MLILTLFGAGCTGCAGNGDDTLLVCSAAVQGSNLNSSLAKGIADQSVGSGDELAQSFKLSEAATISKVELGLFRQGYPDVTLSVRIETAAGATTSNPGVPSTALVSAGATSSWAIDSDASAGTSPLTTSNQFHEFTLGGSVALQADTWYWLRVKASPPNSANHVRWSAAPESTYKGYGMKETTTADSFVSAAVDFAFRLDCREAE